MLYPVLMPNEMNRYPIRQIIPFPVEAKFPYGRMLGEEDAFFPLCRRISRTLILANGSPGCICYITPISDNL
jgi:hypothetical protein